MGYAQGQGNRTGVGRCKQTKPSLWPTGRPDSFRGSAPDARCRADGRSHPHRAIGTRSSQPPPSGGMVIGRGTRGRDHLDPGRCPLRGTRPDHQATDRPNHTRRTQRPRTRGAVPHPAGHSRTRHRDTTPRAQTRTHCGHGPPTALPLSTASAHRNPSQRGHPDRAPTMPTGTHHRTTGRQTRARRTGTHHTRRASTLPAESTTPARQGHGGTGNRGTNPGPPDPNRSRNQDRDRNPNSGPGPGPGVKGRRTGGGRNKGDKGRPHRRGPARHRHPTPAERPPTRARGQWVRRDRNREGGDTSCPPRPHHTRTPIRCRCRAPASRPPPPAPEPAPPGSAHRTDPALGRRCPH
ncbi:hypothetical protein B0I28_107196 [Glycomyces artemisiae]|uniref:Uncharacterized protein n=1 Tax=Glycomyces artemisiae TaxID=1076443 RepID=A0A2T0UHK6_9ACTN|nr:hypothetical protein B0I28_107196 [Glycomyces artemisiae]